MGYRRIAFQRYENRDKIIKEKTIWTIGHSTHSLEDFISLLQAFEVKLLADVRRYPGSRKFPHFNKDTLSLALEGKGIKYLHFPELGGRRNPVPDSLNTAWRVPAFRGYADYMQTDDFKHSVTSLEELAFHERLCFMCSEAVWWSCHRALISDSLKIAGWQVMHIMNRTKAEEHPYTSAARITDGKLDYRGVTLGF